MIFNYVTVATCVSRNKKEEWITKCLTISNLAQPDQRLDRINYRQRTAGIYHSPHTLEFKNGIRQKVPH